MLELPTSRAMLATARPSCSRSSRHAKENRKIVTDLCGIGASLIGRSYGSSCRALLSGAKKDKKILQWH